MNQKNEDFQVFAYYTWGKISLHLTLVSCYFKQSVLHVVGICQQLLDLVQWSLIGDSGHV